MKSTDRPTTQMHTKSAAAFEHARTLMPGGVNSPVRAYQAVGRSPIVIHKAAGCRVIDIDENSYIDYVGAYGPLIVGHAHESVVAAVVKTVSNGLAFGMPTELESQLAQTVIDAVESIELVRFVNSGTEATMSALRLARAATGRNKIIKCIGGYHGHSDGLLVQAGSGATTLGTPSSPGVTIAAAQETLLVHYNDAPAVEAMFRKHPDAIAALIIEPVAGNMGCVPPNHGYLAALRKICDASGAMLIFDEVMTGFRVAYRGAQSLYQVKPDLTCLGKIIGGGLPCAAYGGSESLMRRIAPDGPVYQAGTLSGNPLAMAAGIATLELLRGDHVYQTLETRSARLADGIKSAARKAGVNVTVQRVGSMLTPFFTDQPVRNYQDATRCDTRAFARFFGAMLDAGVTLPPSQFEAWFVSLAHDDEAIDATLAAAQRAFQAVK